MFHVRMIRVFSASNFRSLRRLRKFSPVDLAMERRAFRDVREELNDGYGDCWLWGVLRAGEAVRCPGDGVDQAGDRLARTEEWFPRTGQSLPRAGEWVPGTAHPFPQTGEPVACAVERFPRAVERFPRAVELFPRTGEKVPGVGCGLIGRRSQQPQKASGQQLGIVGPEDTTDLTTAKPTLQANSIIAGSVTIGFNKSSSSGIRLESKRGPETFFVFQAVDTTSPYVDTRANLTLGTPETRQYRAQYLTGDDTIGELSDVLTITVPG